MPSWREMVSKMRYCYAKDLVKKSFSYLQDTPDLLRQLEDMKKTPLPEGTFLVSIDVVRLYSNKPHQ